MRKRALTTLKFAATLLLGATLVGAAGLPSRAQEGQEKKIGEGPLPVKLAYRRAIEAHERDRSGVAGRRDKLALLAAQQAIFPRIRERIGPALIGLICGSAPLSDDTQAWFERIGLPIFQVYGLTETTAIVTIDRKGAVQTGRVGHAIPGCELKLGEGGELRSELRQHVVDADDADQRALLVDDGEPAHGAHRHHPRVA